VRARKTETGFRKRDHAARQRQHDDTDKPITPQRWRDHGFGAFNRHRPRDYFRVVLDVNNLRANFAKTENSLTTNLVDNLPDYLELFKRHACTAHIFARG
jgi:hypothetical protein